MSTHTSRERSDGRSSRPGTDAAPQPLRASVRLALKRYFEDLNGHRPVGLYRMVISEVERPLLETVLTYTRGNQSQAADILGINRNTLRKKLRRYGIE